MSAKNDDDVGLVTYSRRCVPFKRLPRWIQSKKTFPRVRVDSKGKIEDDGFGMLQVDFANAYVGGGVIGRGCVQEEILFLIYPELILSRLFTERLGDNECLVVSGHERFNAYSGYADDFRFDGDFHDPTPFDVTSRHRRTQTVAIDALMFHEGNRKWQYKRDKVERELNKAFVGFIVNEEDEDESLAPVAVATGNWGCGAFGGDPRLKFLIQLMAAAEACRDLAYFTFGDEILRDDVFKMAEELRRKKINVGDLFNLIRAFSQQSENKDLFGFIADTLSYGAETDDEETDGENRLTRALSNLIDEDGEKDENVRVDADGEAERNVDSRKNDSKLRSITEYFSPT